MSAFCDDCLDAMFAVAKDDSPFDEDEDERNVRQAREEYAAEGALWSR